MNNQLQVPPEQKIARLKDVMVKSQHNIKDLIPTAMAKHMTPERITKIILAAASRTPKLLECSPMSILRACMTATQLGLECDGILGGAYLVPYWNSQARCMEAQFQIGYQGMMELARRSGEIARIEVEVVRKGDRFRCTKGIEAVLEHEPDWEADEIGEFRAAYAIARYRDGGYQFCVLTKAEVDRFRSFSKGSERGPWKDHYEAMAKKSAVRQLCKMLPKSVEIRDAIIAETDYDRERETSEGPTAVEGMNGILGAAVSESGLYRDDGGRAGFDPGAVFDAGSAGEMVLRGSGDSECVEAGEGDGATGPSFPD